MKDHMIGQVFAFKRGNDYYANDAQLIEVVDKGVVNGNECSVEIRIDLPQNFLVYVTFRLDELVRIAMMRDE